MGYVSSASLTASWKEAEKGIIVASIVDVAMAQ